MRQNHVMSKVEIRPDSLRPLFIEMFFNEQSLAIGTGFPVFASSGKVYLVTARHNLTGRHAYTDEILHSKKAIPNTIGVHLHTKRKSHEPVRYHVMQFSLQTDSGDNDWLEHPTFKGEADIAAIPLDIDEEAFLHPFNLEHEPVRQTGPADPVSVIGFPFGMSSGDGLPIWATGYMASEPNLDYEGKPIMLIDCRTRTGQSGSPVVSFRSDGVIGNNQFQGTWTAPSSDFLGIYCSRINSESDLGVVWKSVAIKELVDSHGQNA